MSLFHAKIASPLGPLHLLGTETHLTGICFEARWTPALGDGSLVESESTPLALARRQLGEYFGGRLARFDVPFLLTGTDFQQRVWRGLLEIPAGETWTYARLAEQVGTPSATRAVGRTNGLNPLCILLPCHRVVGADGSLTGYAGGLPAKRFLLGLEGAILPDLPLFSVEA